jgi:hypothetical protein
MNDERKGCPECGPFGTPGFVPGVLPPGHPGNPYSYPVDVMHHCRGCNEVRAVVHEAGRDHEPVNADGWPEHWQARKTVSAPHPTSRGWQQPDAGPVRPLPPEFGEIKAAMVELAQVMGLPDSDQAQVRRRELGEVLGGLADEIDARVAARASTGDAGQAAGGRGYLRPVP